MSYREIINTLAQEFLPNVFSEVALENPALPYGIILEDGGERTLTTSAPVITYTGRIDIYSKTRPEGATIRDQLIEALDAHAEGWQFILQPAGVDYDAEGPFFIHAISFTAYKIS